MTVDKRIAGNPRASLISVLFPPTQNEALSANESGAVLYSDINRPGQPQLIISYRIKQVTIGRSHLSAESLRDESCRCHGWIDR